MDARKQPAFAPLLGFSPRDESTSQGKPLRLQGCQRYGNLRSWKIEKAR
jgi:hypothetical protein